MTHKTNCLSNEKPQKDQSYFILMSSSRSIRMELNLIISVYIAQGRATKQCCINFPPCADLQWPAEAMIVHPSLSSGWSG